MMIGELEFAPTFHSHLDSDAPNHQVYFEVCTYTIYFLFLIFMSIIVMNLMTGLAVRDVAELTKESSYKMMAMQIDFALDVEFALPLCLRKKCVVTFAKLKRNKARKVEHGNWFDKIDAFWDGNLFKGKIMEDLDEKWKKSKHEQRQLRKEMDKLEQKDYEKYTNETTEQNDNISEKHPQLESLEEIKAAIKKLYLSLEM
jgi:hypothetical protein